MSRWKIKLFAFSTSLLIGLFSAWFFLVPHDRELHAPAVAAPQMAASPNLETRKKVRAPFDPEFTGLPDFGDHYVSPGGKIIEMVTDGLYRRSDLEAKNGESWLVFTKDTLGGYALERSKASVRNMATGTWPGEELDAKLTLKTKGAPLFAVKNLKQLKPGAIPTLYSRGIFVEGSDADTESEEISTGYRRIFAFNGEDYLFRSSEGLTKDGTKVAVLVMESGGKSQVVKQVYHVPSDDRDTIGSFLWVGDLDSDGKLDLYMDEFNEKGFTRTDLFLSSIASKDQLVAHAASFGVPGC